MLPILACVVGVWIAWVLSLRLSAKPPRQDSPKPDPLPEGTPETRLTLKRDFRTGSVRYEVEYRGRVPISRPASMAAITHAIDVETKMPLVSRLEQFQEPETSVFRFEHPLGDLHPDQAWTDWVTVGALYPDWMIGPRGGRRKIEVLVRFIDVRNRPKMPLWWEAGSHQSGLLWASRPMSVEHSFAGRGYQDISQDRETLLEASVKVAVWMAMSDGALDRSEGEVIKEWMKQCVEAKDEECRPALKKLLNSAFRNAHEESRMGRMELVELLRGLRDIGDAADKYRLLELAFDVLVADGTATSSELGMITQIMEELGLDADEVARTRDRKLLRLEPRGLDGACQDALLGIKPGWDRETIRKHLRTEFQKWNGRLNALPEGRERDHAQKMLDLIAEARTRHA